MAAGAFSVGVEEEYQLVDPESGALQSLAPDLLESDWGGELRAELQETMVEVGTPVCRSSADLARELRRLRLHVGSAAAAVDLGFVAAGLHPFSRWESQLQTRGERYARILERFGRVLRSEHVFGMHVHVSVPEGVDRIPLLARLRGYLPYLLALSASSPFFEGEDTGYASYRAVLVRRLPHSGIPPRFTSGTEYRRFIDLLLDAGTLDDERTIYWGLRPHPVYPTLEFRTTDVCPRVGDAVAIAALARVMVAAAARDELPSASADLCPSAADALLAADEWQAARYGLDATLTCTPEGAVNARSAIDRLVGRLEPVARELGEAELLASGVGGILHRGSGADRMRDAARRCDGWKELVGWLSRESQVGIGMDRRSAQRDPSA